MFSDAEALAIQCVITMLDTSIGHEKTVEAAYPIFMRACALQLDA